jgi:hypothetical protein
MALELADGGKPSGPCRKLLLWMARAYDAGERDWLTEYVLARVCGCSEADVKHALSQLRRLPAPVTGCCIQTQRCEHGKCGTFSEFRLTDDGLLYALDAWPKQTLEAMPKEVVKQVRGARSAEFLKVARELRQKEKQPKVRKRAA